MSWKHQSLRSLEAAALALYQDTLQVLRMAYNLKMFVGSRKIIHRTFRKRKIKGLVVQLSRFNAKPFLFTLGLIPRQLAAGYFIVKNSICSAS
jgi:hypothetical protein